MGLKPDYAFSFLLAYFEHGDVLIVSFIILVKAIYICLKF